MKTKKCLKKRQTRTKEAVPQTAKKKQCHICLDEFTAANIARHVTSCSKKNVAPGRSSERGAKERANEAIESVIASEVNAACDSARTNDSTSANRKRNQRGRNRHGKRTMLFGRNIEHPLCSEHPGCSGLPAKSVGKLWQP